MEQLHHREIFNDIRVWTSDSGGGVPAAANVLKEIVGQSGLELCKHPCALHSLDTAMGWAMGEKGVPNSPNRVDGDAEANKVLKIARGVVKHFSNATQKQELKKQCAKDLAETQAALAIMIEGEATCNLARDQKLIIDGATRCKSIGRMFSTLYQQKEVLEAYFNEHDNLSSDRLSPLEWALISQFGDILSQVIAIQTSFETNTIPTASLVWIVPYLLAKTFEDGEVAMSGAGNVVEWRNVSTLQPVTQTLVKNLSTLLRKYGLQKPTKAMMDAMFLDPRTKFMLLANSLQQARDSIEEAVVKYALATGDFKDDPIPEATHASVPEPVSATKEETYSGFAALKRRRFGVNQPSPPPPVCKTAREKAIKAVKKELDRYAEEPEDSRGFLGSDVGGFDLLQYWVDMKGKYKYLRVVAFSKLGWLASAAGVERIFRLSGLIVT